MPSIAASRFHVPSINKKYASELGVPRTKALSFTSHALARALFTTGRAPADQAAYGMASVYEAMHRCALIPAYVRRDRSGRLMRSRLATELDRSEKGALSYALGQAVTSIFCEQTLGVTHLLHVDRYRLQYNLTFTNGKSRADLFGPGTKGWVVAEAKGRSNNSDAELVKKLRTQKRTVTSILGLAPWVALGCVACFPDPKYRSLAVRTWDPEDPAEEAFGIDGTLDRFFLAYYGPILAALESGTTAPTEQAGLVTARLGGIGLTVGLRTDLFQILTSRSAQTGQLSEEGDLARLVLGERFAVFAGPGALDDLDSEGSPPPDDLERPASVEDRAEVSDPSDDEQANGQVFPDGTYFAADWEAAIRSDDWQEG